MLRKSLCGVILVLALGWAARGGEKIRVVVVTGGHGFNAKAFYSLFEGYDDIEFVRAPQKDHSELFEDVSNWPYDVIVLYNMTQRISDKRRSNFVALLKKGVGLVVLHHALAAFQNWPEFKKIVGGKYYLRPTVEDGVNHPRSAYKHGVRFKVKVADPKHPVTAGIGDFEIHDETYRGYFVDPSVHVLLTTDEPSSGKVLAWAKTYENARVCYIQLGHDANAYSNPAYRKFIYQAIRWAAGHSR